MFGGAARQQARDDRTLAMMAEPRPNHSMKSPEQRDASLKGISVSAISKEPFLESVKNDPRVRDIFVKLNFYCPQTRNYFACSVCDKGGKLVSDPLRGGLDTLIENHNKQSAPQCIKDKSVAGQLITQLYMPAQQPAQAAFYHQHPSATPAPGNANPQPSYPSQHGYRP